MNAFHPRVRVEAKGGYVVIRDGLTFRFFMHRSHKGLGPAVLRMLNVFRQAVGPETLAIYPNQAGYYLLLDDYAWKRIEDELLETDFPFIEVASESNGMSEFAFEYIGISHENPDMFDVPGRACVATFKLTTEYLEQHGPSRVRELALELASHVPFNSGYASLSFNAIMDLVGVRRRVRSMCFRYPGMDVFEHRIHRDIGTRTPGAYWLTFLGQPVLGELGGVEGLRARLSSPGTTVQQLPGDRAVVTLGQWPEAGDLEAGENLPAYRELARVLEPWLYHDPGTVHASDFPSEDKLRWERRFLD
ncbi:DUF3396 domain-containing protein [Pyxidicoccus parkwayensis]|uniref:DUF3396 domain-containing protein n=1 Tax=Pyxidicoccus parkwayensis TaxID=2813578 RepID=A0ABX7NK15_9BACT|nr:DUF3396 domain-containing protein [Pyxidicoccus parkwaysis]QSQ18729.1 DUF3396 domain-containing protein [Pyxidicoccus parkwaysis]